MAVIAAAVIGGVATAGAGYMGSKSNQAAASKVAESQLAASQPRHILGPTGEAAWDHRLGVLRLTPTMEQQIRLGQIEGLTEPLFGLLNDPNFVQSEVDRLRGIARPREDMLRQSLRSRVYNRGRLGLGIGGGITGNAYNPELAALEEAFARADTERVGAARGEQQRLFGNLQGLIGMERDIRREPVELASLSLGTPSSFGAFGAQNMGLQAQMGYNSAFYGELGRSIGGIANAYANRQSSQPSTQSSYQDYSLPYSIYGLGG